MPLINTLVSKSWKKNIGKYQIRNKNKMCMNKKCKITYVLVREADVHRNSQDVSRLIA